MGRKDKHFCPSTFNRIATQWGLSIDMSFPVY
jgi:hypothetical protein